MRRVSQEGEYEKRQSNLRILALASEKEDAIHKQDLFAILHFTMIRRINCIELNLQMLRLLRELKLG